MAAAKALIPPWLVSVHGQREASVPVSRGDVSVRLLCIGGWRRKGSETRGGRAIGSQAQSPRTAGFVESLVCFEPFNQPGKDNSTHPE